MMRGYTTIEQSKVLAGILPIESADMCYYYKDDIPQLVPFSKHNNRFYIPCWSLAALLDIMPDRIDDSHFLTLDKEGKEYCCCYEDINGNSFKHEFADNAIDACYKMIELLHKENLI